MKQDKISIIVPIYNAEAYISRCIESILGQTYGNFEVVLVDDGSVDGSPSICDQYASNDKRVIVIHKENGGVADARNAGLNIANGEYITFIDADDFVSNNYLLELLSISKMHNSEIVQCGFEIGSNNKFAKNSKGVKKTFAYYENEKLTNPYVKVTLWAKLYSAKLFSDIRFPVGLNYEDDAIIHMLLYKANKFSVFKEKGYYYFQSPESIMRNKKGFNFYLNDYLRIYQLKFDYFQSNNEQELYYFMKKRFLLGLVLAYMNSISSQQNSSSLDAIHKLFRSTLNETKNSTKFSFKERIIFLMFRYFPNNFTYLCNILKK